MPHERAPNGPSRLRRPTWWLSAVCALATGCGPGGDVPGGYEGSGEGPGHRRQVLGLSPRDELDAGRRAYRKVLDEYNGRVLPDNHPDTVRVRKIVDRLAKASQIEPLQREINLHVRGYTFDWEVRVIQERQINAFCLPAGEMVVFTGIIPVAENDAQLAAVLSHEMAHALAHHGSERVARERSGAGILSSLKYDRFQESEADKIGVFLMPFAGYDPDEAVNFWRRMVRATGQGGQPPEILSDHPSHATRIKSLAAWAPRAAAAKKAYDEGRIAPAR